MTDSKPAGVRPAAGGGTAGGDTSRGASGGGTSGGDTARGASAGGTAGGDTARSASAGGGAETSVPAASAALTVELPSLLAPLVGAKQLTVRGATLAEALDDLVRGHPQLAVHLFDERGELREHVNCFWRGRSTRWLESLDVPVAEGDVITLLQAVSGG